MHGDEMILRNNIDAIVHSASRREDRVEDLHARQEGRSRDDLVLKKARHRKAHHVDVEWIYSKRDHVERPSPMSNVGAVNPKYDAYLLQIRSFGCCIQFGNELSWQGCCMPA